MKNQAEKKEKEERFKKKGGRNEGERDGFIPAVSFASPGGLTRMFFIHLLTMLLDCCNRFIQPFQSYYDTFKDQMKGIPNVNKILISSL